MLAGTSLGIGRVERATSPVWLNLDDLVNLDAVGDPVDGLTAVEILMDDHRIIGAGWPDHFCDAVVQVLVDSAGRATATVRPPTLPTGPASPPASSAGCQVAAAAAEDTAPAEPGRALCRRPSPPRRCTSRRCRSSTPSRASPDTVPGTSPAPDATPAAALELEDVVYLGGYPGQSKRRKKCVAGMSRAAVELSGPGDLHFRVGWDVVRTIEVQNADEARFRMNTKIHRDASALVIECDQGVTILLEARDCPTIALRSAISQLLDGLPVVVV